MSTEISTCFFSASSAGQKNYYGVCGGCCFATVNLYHDVAIDQPPTVLFPLVDYAAGRGGGVAEAHRLQRR